MTLTSASFVYSGACIFLSPILIMLSQALLTSIKLYRRTRSLFVKTTRKWNNRTAANRTFLLWAIFDSLVNTFISMSFLVYLQHLGARSAVSMRSGMRHLILHTQITIIMECVILFGVCVNQYIQPQFDPYWATTSLIEAIRLRFLTSFFEVLHKVMSQRNDTSTSMQLKGYRQALSISTSKHRSIVASSSYQ
ncbi:hypothetical protein BCR44DRAFT_1435259 [Catenaria anguillulae PL171]|uniref:Uncharacterized protein n=1 Tax=Catenaria anguillulae PL171 TaxID=765915 RepID=A0A1Y2HMC0_9FUNG|nr:hypothetical protein BCR44DRAFT_1435259 [Catenaria anguillulae PL171]